MQNAESFPLGKGSDFPDVRKRRLQGTKATHGDLCGGRRFIEAAELVEAGRAVGHRMPFPLRVLNRL
jgi:hypothetical protein